MIEKGSNKIDVNLTVLPNPEKNPNLLGPMHGCSKCSRWFTVLDDYEDHYLLHHILVPFLFKTPT